MEACCTCAKLLSTLPQHQAGSEKPLPQDRRLDCCGRVICGGCVHNNARFEQYCPYCQISSTPSSLPQGLKPPPSYNSAATGPNSKTLLYSDVAPPPYSSHAVPVPVSVPISVPVPVPTAPRPPLSLPRPQDGEKAALSDAETQPGADATPEDVLHFLDHERDTVTSLSLRYGVPAPALRRANGLDVGGGADHLLAARRTALIPGAWYRGGASLSPRPVEGEEEEARKGRIRRWMVACKVAEYDVAVLYLEQSGGDLEQAVEAYFADEAWEREHPLEEDDDGGGGGGWRGRFGRRQGQGQGQGMGKGKGKSVLAWRWASQAAFLRRQ